MSDDAKSEPNKATFRAMENEPLLFSKSPGKNLFSVLSDRCSQCFTFSSQCWSQLCDQKAWTVSRDCIQPQCQLPCFISDSLCSCRSTFDCYRQFLAVVITPGFKISLFLPLIRSLPWHLDFRQQLTCSVLWLYFSSLQSPEEKNPLRRRVSVSWLFILIFCAFVCVAVVSKRKFYSNHFGSSTLFAHLKPTMLTYEQGTAASLGRWSCYFQKRLVFWRFLTCYLPFLQAQLAAWGRLQ